LIYFKQHLVKIILQVPLEINQLHILNSIKSHKPDDSIHGTNIQKDTMVTAFVKNVTFTIVICNLKIMIYFFILFFVENCLLAHQKGWSI